MLTPDFDNKDVTASAASPTAPSSRGLSATGPPQVADYELIRCVGKGAYGEVWLTRNIMGAYRAVKIVYRSSFDNDRPFEREFDGIRKFEPISRTHESQLSILHMGRADGCFYYVMELADQQGRGQDIEPHSYAPTTLRSELQFYGRLPFAQCLRIGLALTTALEHLHKNGLVHRDIKPSNAIFVNGIPKLADIGLVASADETMSFVGTEGYVPPEGPGSAQADIYSLGKLLYEITMGRDRQDFPELPTDLRHLPDHTELSEMNEVLVKACQTDPKRRYKSAAEMNADLAMLNSGKSLARLRRTEKRLRFVQRAVAVATVIAAIIAGGWLWQARQTKVVRELANEKSQLAEKNAQLAAANAAAVREGQQRLIQIQTANGLRLMENGDFSTAALWFTEVLKLAGGDADLERRQRDRLASLFDRLPKPIAMFSMGCAGLGVRESPDGKWLIGVGSSTNQGSATGEVRIWDTTSFQQLYSLSVSNVIGNVWVSPSGRWAVAHTDKGKQIWDVVAGIILNNHLEAGGIGGTSAWSPDETKIATAAADGTNVYVLEVPSGRVSMPPLQHSNRVIRVAFDLSGHWVFTGTEAQKSVKPPYPSGQARVWSVATGRPVSEWIETENPAWGVDFSPDNSAVAIFGGGKYGDMSGLTSHKIVVIDLPSGKPRYPALPHGDTVSAVKYSPDGRYLAIGGVDRTVTVWNARSGERVHAALRHGNIDYRLRFTPDGNWLAATGETDIQLWDVKSGVPLCPPLQQREQIYGAAFTMSGQRLVTLTPTGRIHVWGLTKIEPKLPPFSNESGHIWTSAVFSPRKNQLATANGGGDVGVWDTISGQPLGGDLIGTNRTEPIIAINNLVDWSPDGCSLVVPVGDNTARVWDVTSGKERLSPLQHQSVVLFSEFSPDGKRIATASADSTAQIWDATTGMRSMPPLQHSSLVREIRFSPDGCLVVTAADHTATVWNAFTGNVVSPAMPSDGQVLHVVFSPDSKRVAMSDNGGTITIHDAVTGQRIGSAMRHASIVHHIGFSPNGRYLLSTSMDRSARVWSAETGKPISPPMVHNGFVLWGDFSPDSRRIVTGSFDCTTRSWDTETGEPVAPAIKHEKPVYYVSFSPDGRQVSASSSDGRAQVWDVPTLDWSVAEITAAAHLLANSHLGSSERVEPLPSDQMEAAWQVVSSRFKEPASHTDSKAARWHYRRSVVNQLQQDWYAAEFHARRRIELQPNDSAAQAHLARILEIRIPARDTNADPALVDLSAFYNVSLAVAWSGGSSGNHLGELPHGIQTFAGTQFDVRGLVQVAGGLQVTKYPKQVNGILVGRKFKRLHILHSVMGGIVPDGTKVGHYLVRYTNGRCEEIPIIYGTNARDWHEHPDVPVDARDAVIAWKGSNPENKQVGTRGIRLFKYTWNNPAPDIEVTKVDFVAESERSHPFLVAITAE